MLFIYRVAASHTTLLTLKFARVFMEEWWFKKIDEESREKIDNPFRSKLSEDLISP